MTGVVMRGVELVDVSIRTRWTCRGTRWLTRRVYHVTGTRGRRSTPCSRCDVTGWRRCARLSTGLTADSLAGDTEPVDGPGWPQSRSYPVRECLLTVLNEEWEHRLYAERDLDALEAARTADQGSARPAAG